MYIMIDENFENAERSSFKNWNIHITSKTVPNITGIASITSSALKNRLSPSFSFSTSLILDVKLSAVKLFPLE